MENFNRKQRPERDETFPQMKTIVYFSDGSIEATANADAIVARGDARYATPREIRSYERAFETADLAWERMAMEGDSGPSQPSHEY